MKYTHVTEQVIERDVEHTRQRKLMAPHDQHLTLRLSDRDTDWTQTSSITQTSVIHHYPKKSCIDVMERIEYFLNAESGSVVPKNGRMLHTRNIVHSKDIKADEEVDYELVGLLGEGGMGKVYEARQNATGRMVAIKILENTDPQVRYEFAREAIINANLEHPGIIRVYELAISEQFGLFYAMERIEGEPWSHEVGSQSMEEKLTIFMRLLDAVSYAHACGIIHRDLKPSNIMLGKYGNILLVDWGLALSQEEIDACIKIPNLYGSLSYMAPEMLSTETRNLGIHSDIYMLGAILYHIMEGRPPHDSSGDVKERVRLIRSNKIEPSENFPLLSKIMQKALSTKPEDRYLTVSEFHAAMENYLQNRNVYALVQKGNEHYWKGKDEKSLHSLSRALFAYQDALLILPNSQTARDSCLTAEEALAETALALGDIAYASRMTASNNFINPDLKREVELAVSRLQRNQKRSHVLAIVASVFGGLLFGILVFGLWYMRHETQKSEAVATLSEPQRLSDSP
ncbi:serine/threonine-protein kinase [Kiritimatiellota bacterium B12222]|nr:serine/threonine-protein kinase [Kiritimatiellota bacterium B12222]